jgi:hypothetical protein
MRALSLHAISREGHRARAYGGNILQLPKREAEMKKMHRDVPRARARKIVSQRLNACARARAYCKQNTPAQFTGIFADGCARLEKFQTGSLS